MKRPTMRDVARKAGVSTATVSHVMNRTRFVHEETRQRVLEAIAELGYRPSSVARSLTTHRTQTIGVLLSSVSNPFFAEVLCGIEDVLMPEGYSIIVCNTGEAIEREAHHLDVLLRQRVDGIIAAAASRRWDVLTEFEMQQLPVVFVDRTFDGLKGAFVGVDNRKAAYLGTRYLVECGRQRLGILAGATRLSSLDERLAGFRQALQEHNLSLPDEWVITEVEDVGWAIRTLMSLPERPTALFCSTNYLALDALLAFKEMGLRCPKDVALVGFDDHPWAAVSDPPLTVVRQPARQLGQVAAQVLFDLVADRGATETRILLDCELVVRESC